MGGNDGPLTAIGCRIVLRLEVLAAMLARTPRQNPASILLSRPRISTVRCGRDYGPCPRTTPIAWLATW